MGWDQYRRTPQSATYIENGNVCSVAVKPLAIWGSDNTGIGFESVMVDFTQLGAGQNEVVVDCRAFWYGTLGSNVVSLSFTLYKGGCIVKQGASGSPAYTFSNPTATSSLAGASASKVITAYKTSGNIATGSSDLESPNITSNLTRGQRLAVIKYNRTTNVGSIDIYDTTTPVV